MEIRRASWISAVLFAGCLTQAPRSMATGPASCSGTGASATTTESTATGPTSSSGTGGTPANCDPIANTGCDAGLVCHLKGDQQSSSCFTACEPPYISEGNVGEGGACCIGAGECGANFCRPGLVCLGISVGPPTCFSECTTDGVHGCPGTHRCLPYTPPCVIGSTTYGLCECHGAGDCTWGCATASDCPAYTACRSNACVNGRCVPSYVDGPCNDNGGRVCVFGSCMPCALATDCPAFADRLQDERVRRQRHVPHDAGPLRHLQRRARQSMQRLRRGRL